MKVCDLCKKYHKSRTHLCGSCNKKSQELAKKLGVKSHHKKKKKKPRLSNRRLLKIKEEYDVVDVFKFIKNNPNKYYGTQYNRKEAAKRKTLLREELRSDEYKSANHMKGGVVPEYIEIEMIKHVDKKLLYVAGEKGNPSVFFVCLYCDEEHMVQWDDLKLGRSHKKHNQSSGELIVESYLKKRGLGFKKERNTLRCKNPITNYNLPYDFELADHKVLIEVQGDQHYRYIEFFHGNYRNFEYQLYKDKVKKRNAEKKGYEILYINYTDFNDGLYIGKIEAILQELKRGKLTYEKNSQAY